MTSGARKVMDVFRGTLSSDSSQRNTELTRLSVQVGALDAECLGGVGHPPSVMLEHSRDVVTLEPQPRVAQIAGRHERGVRAIELQRRKEPLDLNDLVARVGHH